MGLALARTPPPLGKDCSSSRGRFDIFAIKMEGINELDTEQNHAEKVRVAVVVRDRIYLAFEYTMDILWSHHVVFAKMEVNDFAALDKMSH